MSKATQPIKYFIKLTLIMLGLLSVQSCSIKEDLSDCINKEFMLYVKVIDIVTGEDITESVAVEDASLHIFDHNKAFFKSYTISAEQIKQKEPIIINDFDPDKMIISAWGNPGNKVNKWQPNSESRLESRALSLVQDPENPRYDQSPDNFFYGYHMIGKNKKVSLAEEIILTQKNAKLHIVVRGLSNPQENDYYFKIINRYNGYDFSGNPLLTPSIIKEKGIFNSNKDYVSPLPYLMIHSPSVNESFSVEDENVWIHLYEEKNNTEIARINKDNTGNNITLSSGKTTNVLIDIIDNSTLFNVYIQVTPWDEVYQWTEY